MAERKRTTTGREQTFHFVVYDRRSGRVLAVHHVTARSGVRVPGEAVMLRRLLACAAGDLDCRAADLAVLRTSEAPTVSPSLSVDVATGRLRAGDDATPAADRPEGGTQPSAVALP